MPALISAIASAIYASMATTGEYQSELQDIFPAMVGTNGTETKIMGVSIRCICICNCGANPFLSNSRRVSAGTPARRRATNCLELQWRWLLPSAVAFWQVCVKGHLDTFLIINTKWIKFWSLFGFSLTRGRVEVHQLPEPEEGRTPSGWALLGSSRRREQGGIVSRLSPVQRLNSVAVPNVPCLTPYDYDYDYDSIIIL